MEICLSISTREPERLSSLTKSAPLVELRCDLMAIEPEEVAALVERAERAIVTCHSADLAYAEEIYSVAIGAGAWAVDIDFHTPSELRTQIAERAQGAGTKVIFSHHFDTTPQEEELCTLAEEMFACGCDIAKIITTAQTTAEALVPMRLYDMFAGREVVAFVMGEAGAFTRRLSLLRGAPYTYAAPSAEERTAAGQPTIEELRESLAEGESLEGYTLPHSVTPPSSKSEAQRAIVLAAICEGNSVLHGYTPCGDTQAAIDLARQLGAKVTIEGNELVIEGVGTKGLQERLSHPTTLSVGESALLARIALPLVALHLGKGEVAGGGTLATRSLACDIATLCRYGAECKSNDGRVPIEILSGAQVPRRIAIDGGGSSQGITGWAIALGGLGGAYTLEVANPTSRPYIALSAKMMEQFGASVRVASGENLTIDIDSSGYRATTITLSADWSGAAYFATAYAIAQSGRAQRKEGYTLRARLGTEQADERIVDILRSVGAQIEQSEEGLRFMPSEALGAFAHDATDCPDLIPTLAVVALFCEGTSRIGGLHRLANKESNRAEAIVECLVALGARVAIEGDELVIEGASELHSAPLRSHNDHRIAMAMTIATLFMASKPTIDNKGCVAKSYPDFFEQLKEK